MDLRAIGAGKLGHQESERAAAEHQDSIAWFQCGGTHRAKCVAAGLHHRAGRVVDAVGQRKQRRDRDCELLGERARCAPADTDLDTVLADVVAP